MRSIVLSINLFRRRRENSRKLFEHIERSLPEYMNVIVKIIIFFSHPFPSYMYIFARCPLKRLDYFYDRLSRFWNSNRNLSGTFVNVCMLFISSFGCL